MKWLEIAAVVALGLALGIERYWDKAGLIAAAGWLKTELAAWWEGLLAARLIAWAG